MEKVITKVLLGVVTILIGFSAFLLGLVKESGHTSFGGQSVYTTASTSIITVDGTGNALILATSSKRTGAAIQLTSCSSYPAATIVLNIGQPDRPATTTAGNTGLYVTASTTMVFDDSGFGHPVPHGAVRAMYGPGPVNGSCVAQVTEWITSF